MWVRAGRRAGSPAGWFDSPRTQEVHETPRPDGQGMCACATRWLVNVCVRDHVVNECVRARPGGQRRRMCTT